MSDNYNFALNNDEGLEFRSFRESHSYQAGGSDNDDRHSGHESEVDAGNYFSDEEYKSNDDKKDANYDKESYYEKSDFNTNNNGDYGGDGNPYDPNINYEDREGTPQSNAPVDNDNMEWSSNYNEYAEDEENYNNHDTDNYKYSTHHYDDNQMDTDIQQPRSTDAVLKLQAEELLSGRDSIMEPRITEAIDRLIHLFDWTPEKVVKTLVEGYTGVKSYY